jgi:cytochrome c biogenesis protein CcmG/thiol:disulfide interchange protein DsbE
MRRRTVTAALLAAGGVGAWPALAIDAGQTAPDVELPAAMDAAPRLSALKGRLVYLDFWASWCGPCRQSFPWMNEMQAKYGARGLKVVAINLDAKRADADAFLAQVPARFGLAFDAAGQSARRFGVKGMPTSVLIGRNGEVLSVHQGFREDERQALEARLVAVLGTS